jgi:hypothetical protein
MQQILLNDRKQESSEILRSMSLLVVARIMTTQAGGRITNELAERRLT